MTAVLWCSDIALFLCRDVYRTRTLDTSGSSEAELGSQNLPTSQLMPNLWGQLSALYNLRITHDRLMLASIGAGSKFRRWICSVYAIIPSISAVAAVTLLSAKSNFQHDQQNKTEMQYAARFAQWLWALSYVSHFSSDSVVNTGHVWASCRSAKQW